jgi:1-acyl-sn-glycerol-3-phosphate acyltransferase
MRKAATLLNLICTTLFLSLLVLCLSPIDRDGRLTHRVARLWAKIHLRVSGIRVRAEGLERMERGPFIFMCNHSSALDIFALFSAIPHEFRWVAKRELFLIPFFGWALRRAGYIALERENPGKAVRAIKEAKSTAERQMSLVIFPEGTRSPDGTLLPFKRGGFFIALKTGLPILPVGIVGARLLQPRGSVLPRGAGDIHVIFGEAVCAQTKGKDEIRRLMEEVRRRIEGLCQGR